MGCDKKSHWDDAMSQQADTSVPAEMQSTSSARNSDQVESNQPSDSMIHTARLVLAGLIVSGIATGYLTRDNSERFAGYLQTETHQVVSPVDGVVEFVDFRTGQVVLPGRELFSIRSTQLETQIAAAEDAVSKATENLQAACAESKLMREQRLVGLGQGIFQTKLQLSEFIQAEYQHKFEVTAIEESIELFDALATTKPPMVDLESVIINSRKSSEQAEVFSIINRATRANQLETLQAKISLCENHLKELSVSKNNIAKQIDSFFHIDELKSRVEEAQSQLDDVSSQDENHLILAPVFGMAGVMDCKLDDRVQTGDVLAEFFDRDREFIDVQLPSRVIATLNADSLVALHFPNDVEREGKIESIPPHVSTPGTKEQPESTLRLRVLTTGKPWPSIPVGSTVYVSLVEAAE